MNLTFAGVGNVIPGTYESIHISGAVRLEGPIVCEELHVSGSAGAKGSLECSDGIRVSGAFSSQGAVKSKSIHVSGVFKTEDELTVTEDMKVSGLAKIQKTIKTSLLQVAGNLETQGDIEAEKADITGVIRCDGLLNAEDLRICTNKDSCVRSIGGHSIEIKRTPSSAFRGGPLRRLFARFRFSDSSPSALFAVKEFVEGDTILLEKVQVPTVRGRDVTIGSGCKVENVQYSGTLTVAPDAEVGDAVKE